MARRPVFLPESKAHPFVRETYVDFDWFSGFALSQIQKSIASLHQKAADRGISPVLEISSKSEVLLGKKLSAFNLFIKPEGYKALAVECAFQGSKIFEKEVLIPIYTGH